MMSRNAMRKIARKTMKRIFRRQAMAICFRETAKGRELLLVTKRSNPLALTFPKGHVEAGETAAAAAAREAFEEAGVLGTLEPGPPHILYLRKNGGLPVIRMEVFRLRVETLATDYPEAALRERRWLALRDAEPHVPPRLKALVPFPHLSCSLRIVFGLILSY